MCVENELAGSDAQKDTKDTKDTKLDTLTGAPLALDLETCAEVKVVRRGRPTITATREALDPWKGEIRLLTLADQNGAVQSFDFRDLRNAVCGGDDSELLPAEIQNALERCPLIVHNACFDLLFLKVRLGIVPFEIFCTMTASRLLSPTRGVRHSLEAVLERELGVQLPKEHGGSDWGALFLTEAQLAYARDDVAHLHALRAKLEQRLNAAGLEKVFEPEMRLIPIVIADDFWNWTGKVPAAFHTLCDYQLARRLICLGRPKWHEHSHNWSKN